MVENIVTNNYWFAWKSNVTTWLPESVSVCRLVNAVGRTERADKAPISIVVMANSFNFLALRPPGLFFGNLFCVNKLGTFHWIFHDFHLTRIRSYYYHCVDQCLWTSAVSGLAFSSLIQDLLFAANISRFESQHLSISGFPFQCKNRCIPLSDAESSVNSDPSCFRTLNMMELTFIQIIQSALDDPKEVLYSNL